MACVHRSHPIRDKQINRSPDQLVPPIPEQGLRLKVHESDHAIGVDRDDGVRRRVEHITQCFAEHDLPAAHGPNNLVEFTTNNPSGRPRR